MLLIKFMVKEIEYELVGIVEILLLWWLKEDSCQILNKELGWFELYSWSKK